MLSQAPLILQLYLFFYEEIFSYRENINTNPLKSYCMLLRYNYVNIWHLLREIKAKLCHILLKQVSHQGNAVKHGP